MTTEINKYLKHLVDINHITFAEGSREVVSETNVPAFIAQRRRLAKDSAGDHEGSRTIVYLKISQTISMQDEVVVDGFTRSIRGINKPRNLAGIRYLRVFLS